MNCFTRELGKENADIPWVIHELYNRRHRGKEMISDIWLEHMLVKVIQTGARGERVGTWGHNRKDVEFMNKITCTCKCTQQSWQM